MKKIIVFLSISLFISTFYAWVFWGQREIALAKVEALKAERFALNTQISDISDSMKTVTLENIDQIESLEKTSFFFADLTRYVDQMLADTTNLFNEYDRLVQRECQYSPAGGFVSDYAKIKKGLKTLDEKYNILDAKLEELWKETESTKV